MRIVVAYDGSDCANIAIGELVNAGIPVGSEILVISVSELFPVPVAVGGADLLAAQPYGDPEMAKALAKNGALKLANMLPEAKVSSEGYTGSAAHEVLKRSESWGADMIVGGSHGRGVFRRALLGSVSVQLAHGSHCTIRVSRRARWSNDSLPPKILLALDGSNYSEPIIDSFLSRSWPNGTTVKLVSGAEYSYDDKEEASILKRLEELHASTKEKLDNSGIAVESIIDTKAVHPKRLILHQAKEMEADTIILGARGLTAFERFVLGSISSSIAMQAECSVDIIRPKA